METSLNHKGAVCSVSHHNFIDNLTVQMLNLCISQRYNIMATCYIVSAIACPSISENLIENDHLSGIELKALIYEDMQHNHK